MAADHLDEHQLAHAQEDALPARPALPGLGERELDERASRSACRFRRRAQVDEARHGGEHGVERAQVAAEEAAADARRSGPGALRHDGRSPAGGHLAEEAEPVFAGSSARIPGALDMT